MKTLKRIFFITSQISAIPDWTSGLNKDKYRITFYNCDDQSPVSISRPEEVDIILAEPLPETLRLFEQQLSLPEHSFGLPVVFILNNEVQTAFGEELENLEFQKVYTPFHIKNLEAIVDSTSAANEQKSSIYKGHSFVKIEEKNAELLGQYSTMQKLELFGMVVFDHNGIITDTNDYYCKMTGFQFEELIGKNVLEIDAQDGAEQFKQKMHLLKTEGQIRFETRHRRKDLTLFDAEVSIGFWAEKEKFIAFVTDITDRVSRHQMQLQMEAKLKLALEAANEGVWDWDIQRDSLYWSPRSFTMLGYEPDEFLLNFNKFKELIHPDDLPDMLVTLQDKLSESEIFVYEFRYRKKDNDYLWVLGKGRIIEWGYDGNPKRLIGTHSDIHQRKIAQLRLEETEQHYRIVADWTYDWEMWIRPDHTIEYISPSVERITGYSTEEFHANPELIDRIISPAYKDSWLEHKKHVHMMTKDGISCNLQTQIITKTGELKWIGHLSRTIHNEEGKSLGLRVSNRDLTDMIDALHEVQKLKAAIEQSSFIVMITDINGIIEYVNAPAERITLYSKEEMIGQKMSLFKSGAVPVQKYKELWETILSGHIWNGELINKKKNGLLYWESVEISPIRDSQGRITHFLATKEDISERKLMENELSAYRSNLEMIVAERTKRLVESETKLNKALEAEKALSEIKTRFITTASHEFRTPLAAILSASQAIQMYGEKWSRSKTNAYQKKIEDSIRHLTSMLDEILNISKVEQGHIKPQYVPIVIEEFLQKCIGSAKHYLHDQTEFTYMNKLKRKSINCDRQMLRSIIENLLTNAFKFTPPGRSVIFVLSEAPGYYVFTVQDEGIGMSKDELDRVYEPFYRAQQSNVIPGTGLGLNIVQQYISILNGTISVQSKPGSGTIFIVRIPKKVT